MKGSRSLAKRQSQTTCHETEMLACVLAMKMVRLVSGVVCSVEISRPMEEAPASLCSVIDCCVEGDFFLGGGFSLFRPLLIKTYCVPLQLFLKTEGAMMILVGRQQGPSVFLLLRCHRQG